MNKTSIVGSIPKDSPEEAVFGRIGGIPKDCPEGAVFERIGEQT